MEKNISNPYGVQFVTREKFHELASKEEPTENLAIHQPYIMDEIKAPTDGSRKMTFAISTEAVDRDRDIIKADGWKLKNYKKNPVILWAHNYHEPPIAKASKIGVMDSKLMSDAEFLPEEVWPFAEAIFQMLSLGALRSASVGFRINKFEVDEERRGFDINEAELLEWSVVPVPANPEALVQARSIMKGTPPMKAYVEWCEKFLDEEYGGKGMWIPKEQVEAVFKFMNDNKTSFQVGGIIKEPVREIIGGDSSETIFPINMDLPGVDANVMSKSEMEAAGLSIFEPDPDPVLILEVGEKGEEDAEPREDEVQVDMEVLGKQIQSTIAEGVCAIVTDTLRQEINYARGKID